MVLDGIILTCAQQINGERSEANIFRLLTGNRSLQTLQDASLYKIKVFYGLLKKLQKKDYHAALQQLNKRQLIELSKDGDGRLFLKVTNMGRGFLESSSNLTVLSFFNGKEFHETGEIFYNRLLLLIQTLTNTRKNHLTFIPIIDDKDIHSWVKIAYNKVRYHEAATLSQLETEIGALLEKCTEMMANLFVDRLTVYNHYGKSLEQLSRDYNQPIVNIRLLLTATVHFILTEVSRGKSNYPVLSKIIVNKQTSIELQQSTKQTYTLFQQSYSPEEIAVIRKLKLNTIYDHLAEIALKDRDFPFNQFITADEKRLILQAIKEANHFKLKAIKEKLTDDISYFQIRLMLAWYQHHENDLGQLSQEEG